MVMGSELRTDFMNKRMRIARASANLYRFENYEILINFRSFNMAVNIRKLNVNRNKEAIRWKLNAFPAELRIFYVYTLFRVEHAVVWVFEWFSVEFPAVAIYFTELYFPRTAPHYTHTVSWFRHTTLFNRRTIKENFVSNNAIDTE